MAKLDQLQLTKAQARELAHSIIDGLIETHDEGEWISLSLNITAGPKEGPVATMCFMPGTTKENAVGVQTAIGQALIARNE